MIQSNKIGIFIATVSISLASIITVRAQDSFKRPVPILTQVRNWSNNNPLKSLAFFTGGLFATWGGGCFTMNRMIRSRNPLTQRFAWAVSCVSFGNYLATKYANIVTDQISSKKRA